MSQYEGKIVTVLCEGSSKKDENVLAGYTDKNKLVNFKGPRESIENSLMSKLTRQNNIL